MKNKRRNKAAAGVLSLNLQQFQDAIALAAYAHGNQCDKGREPKLWHVVRVGASLLPDVEAAVVGILHDTLEDTGLSLDQIRASVPLTVDQAEALRLVTHDKLNLPYLEYVRRIAIAEGHAGAIARQIKLADLRDNLDLRRQQLASRRSGATTMKPLRERYLRAIALLTCTSEMNQEKHDFHNKVLDSVKTHI